MNEGGEGKRLDLQDITLTDTHAHLDAPAFANDLEKVLSRARDAAIGAIVVPGLDLKSSARAVCLAHQHPDLYAAVGVHPHEARTLTIEGLAQLEKLAADPRVVAIGEIGLDFYRDLSPRRTQVWAFGELLALARRVGKPVIVHDREAHEEVLDALERHAQGQGFQGGVLHAFSGDLAMALQATEWGYHLGLGGPVTYPKAEKTREVAAKATLSRLLLETDCPYLPPQPYRGRRNEPAWVTFVAEAIARERNLPLGVIAQTTTENARLLLGLATISHLSQQAVTQ